MKIGRLLQILRLLHHAVHRSYLKIIDLSRISKRSFSLHYLCNWRKLRHAKHINIATRSPSVPSHRTTHSSILSSYPQSHRIVSTTFPSCPLTLSPIASYHPQSCPTHPILFPRSLSWQLALLISHGNGMAKQTLSPHCKTPYSLAIRTEDSKVSKASARVIYSVLTYDT